LFRISRPPRRFFYGAAYDRFGAALDINGDVAIVGAPYDDSGSNDDVARHMSSVSTKPAGSRKPS